MSRVDEVLRRLNPEQYRAATSPSSCILCVAGAGSGKTSVLTSRIGNLQVNERVGTSNMLALTFTRLAAKEMKERVASLIGEEFAKKLTAGTFHSFCVSVLRQHAHKVGRDRDFSVYDEEDRRSLIESVIADLRYTSKVRASQVNPWSGNAGNAEMKAVVDEYHYRLKANNATDLEGLLAMTEKLLSENPDIAAELSGRFSYVYVDEYQDTDDRQERILNLLRPANLFVVGDPAQSIYGWRGARIENILTFEERHPGCEVVRLEQNYRSTKPVIELANRTIERAAYQSPLQLRTDKEGDDPSVNEYLDDALEAQAISEKIQQQVAAGESTKDMAILCRTNFQLQIMQAALEQAGIPTFVVGSRNDAMNPYDVRRIVDYLAFVANPKDELPMNRIINWPERRIGDIALLQADPEDIAALRLPELAGLKQFKEGIKALPCWHSVRETWNEIVRGLGLKERYEQAGIRNRIEELDRAEQFIARWEVRQQEMGEPFDPYAFLHWMRTRDMQERLAQEEADGVRLLTIHAAKGLEWERVFVIGVNEEILPSKRGDIEEERRLFYVAVTRARQWLHLSHLQQREGYGGKVQELVPSRFLGVIEHGG
ncbi:ATP-dependent helicase [Cohnella massiliensis]|uniref:ATP-dependent helicase n=1 Tax=Cohnella massiliensis TaxID=1816691 RepID=UPI0009BA58A3|nr:UvrD-helicase domain-containing protein [Cohnella massiliensis]